MAKLSKSMTLDAADLAALDRLLEHRITVRKAKDVIVEGYEYKVLHVVESGFAIRYKLLHTGKRQIVNVIMPGDIIGFPACFYEHAIFSVTALGEMVLHPVPIDHFADICLTRGPSRRHLFGLLRGRRRCMPSTLSTQDGANHSRDLRTSFWRC